MNRALFVVLLLGIITAGCRQDMYNQPRTKPDSASDFFSDGTTARPLPAHAIEYQSWHENDSYYTGLEKGEVLVAHMPVPLTADLLKRGRERFNIYCSVCHGAAGDGQGEVVKRGFPAPPSYHTDRLRNAPIGHFYDVMTNGYGIMYSYASRVEPRDRWAIAAYIRALQLSQHASAADLPPNDQRRLEDSR
jgi:cytochrome c